MAQYVLHINYKQVIKVIWHKTASPRRRLTVQSYSPGGANVPSHVGTFYIGVTWRIRLKLCTLAPPGEYDWTCAGPPKSTTQMADRSVQPFLHSWRQKVPILYNGRLFPLKLPILMGDLDPHLTLYSLGQSKPTIQTASRLVQPFLHRW